MSPNPVGWFEIYVDELPRAKAFYEAVFQCQLEPLPTPVGELRMLTFPMAGEAKGASGALGQMHGVCAGANSTLVYFSCEDCSVEESRIVPAGGKIHRGKMSIGPYGFITLAFDTEGNMIGLHSRK